MRRLTWSALLGAALLLHPSPQAEAQWGGYTSTTVTTSAPPYFRPPGFYGTAYGYPGFGYPRTYSAFSSPYGAGYGYGYAPYAFLPGRYGVGLWRPGVVTPGYVYGASYYRTFPVPYRPLVPFTAPAFGNYAPGYGPPSFTVW